MSEGAFNHEGAKWYLRKISLTIIQYIIWYIGIRWVKIEYGIIIELPNRYNWDGIIWTLYWIKL